MNNIYDGGPAFPVLDTDEHRQPYYSHYGMSLRDWFAGHIAQGLLAAQNGGAATEFASLVYEIADAMLQERKKGAE